ncbi:MAG TPA: TIR domain-containing protein [Casimicrobiaceae bacterium]|nr:TIR domain-containing protein [Casimicrobiaceae bacterium]
MSESSNAIFLSYASQDADAARRICDALRAAGLEVWFDQSELRGGDAWDASIRRRIKDCRLFVPLISANTNARSEGYFRLEWKLAVDRSHLMADDQPFLFPVIVDATSEQGARVPDRFRERQWSRLTDASSIAAFAAWIPHMLPAGAGAPPTAARDAETTSPGIDDTPSIAVLAFANRSSDAEDEYFSDGLADELLNVLAKIRGLRVAARTSSFQFKGKNEDIGAIGRKLKVSTVLEGSVRKSGNRVRISVQLLKVSDGYHLWSETYDRTLDDIFAVQDEIARTVVAELREMLLGAKPGANAMGVVTREVAAAAKGRSENGEAYRLYLKGHFLVERMSGADLTRGVEYLQAAIKLDPDFALALATLSHAHTLEGIWGLCVPSEGVRHAREAAQRSLALEPDLAEGLLALGSIQLWYDWDWVAAEASLRRALELAPNNPEVSRELGYLMYVVGRYEESVQHCRRAVEQDPLNAMSYSMLAFPLIALQRLQEVEENCRKALELSPDGISFRYVLATTLEVLGRREEAEAEALIDKTEWSRLTCLACIYARSGRMQESDAMLAQLVEKYAHIGAVQIAQVHAARGEIDAALPWLDRARAQHDAGITNVRTFYYFDALRGDPRWPAFLAQLNLAD